MVPRQRCLKFTTPTRSRTWFKVQIHTLEKNFCGIMSDCELQVECEQHCTSSESYLSQSQLYVYYILYQTTSASVIVANMDRGPSFTIASSNDFYNTKAPKRRSELNEVYCGEVQDKMFETSFVVAIEAVSYHMSLHC